MKEEVYKINYRLGTYCFNSCVVVNFRSFFYYRSVSASETSQTLLLFPILFCRREQRKTTLKSKILFTFKGEKCSFKGRKVKKLTESLKYY